MRRHKLRAVSVATVLACMGAGRARAGSTIYIDPTAAPGGNGSFANPYNDWGFGQLQAGTTYLQRAGTTYTGVIYDQTKATAANPILIGSYGGGAPPIVEGAVDFIGSQYATLQGFQLTNSTMAPVLVQQGSSYVTISGNVVASANTGIWLGNGAGAGNTVIGNTISHAAGSGIIVDGVNGTQTSPTSIIANLVTDCGRDGILVSANHVVVKANTTNGNGTSGPGASGIHIYASSATAGTGQHNTITGNIAIGNVDQFDQDGNGILLDQWTRNNVVKENLVMQNDGAGIGLYDAAHNRVAGNIAIGNAVDSGHTHSIRAEFVLASSLGLTGGNLAEDNTWLSLQADGEASFVDALAVQAGNAFYRNVLENPGNGALYMLSGSPGQEIGTWNTALAATDRDSYVAVAPPGKNTPVYAYSFPPGTQLSLTAQTVTLMGWTPTSGLVGTTN